MSRKPSRKPECFGKMYLSCLPCDFEQYKCVWEEMCRKETKRRLRLMECPWFDESGVCGVTGKKCCWRKDPPLCPHFHEGF